ncbi:MAG TPA: cytochrome P450 [Acidimicrobiales bacterium]|nr:cytochrome P450 [Acidimicrobiales bacterium]
MTTTDPTPSWADDYDIFDPRYVSDPFPIWDELRQECPVPHTERWGGSWMPTRYEDVSAVAHDTDHFSSREVLVTPPPEYDGGEGEEMMLALGGDVSAPPITSDPPEHQWARRLILPMFAPKAVEKYEPITRDLCRSLVEEMLPAGRGDAAVGYSQQIPVRIIAKMLGIPDSMSDTFTTWVRGALEIGATDPAVRQQAFKEIITYLFEELGKRKEHPGDDIISELLAAEVDGEPVPDFHILGTGMLILIAGIDTTWSAIGSALWHLATHPEDRRRLVAEPEIMPLAVEELLRAYSPVTMARVVKQDAEVNGCPMKEGERVLLSFPSANRDPEVFERADEVILDRAKNRHIAFGAGIHRCAGSNLARMELRVAIEEWLRVVPEFSLEEGREVTWAGGQVRGPRSLPVVFS